MTCTVTFSLSLTFMDRTGSREVDESITASRSGWEVSSVCDKVVKLVAFPVESSRRTLLTVKEMSTLSPDGVRGSDSVLDLQPPSWGIEVVVLEIELFAARAVVAKSKRAATDVLMPSSSLPETGHRHLMRLVWHQPENNGNYVSKICLSWLNSTGNVTRIHKLFAIVP